MFFTKIKVIALLSLVCLSVNAFSAEKNSTQIRIGVLAKRGSKRCVEKWSPTAEYLTKEIPGHTFSIVPLSFEEVSPAVERDELEFVLVNPAIYIALEHLYDVKRIATLVNRNLGSEFAGTVFTLRKNSEIKDFKDLVGKSFMAVNKNSFGGWLMVLREFEERGINPKKKSATQPFRFDTMII